MASKRHWAWPAAALLFGAAILPFLVYYTGTATLGAYARGGPPSFVAAYYRDLAGLRPSAWLLLLGPAVLVLFWQLLVALAWPRTAPDEPERTR